MTDDYEKLGLGKLTSFISEIEIDSWGSQLTLKCVYDPRGDRLPYTLTFCGCKHLHWEVHDPDLVNDLEADLIGIHMGKEHWQAPAIIHTDIFELTSLYDYFEVKLCDSDIITEHTSTVSVGAVEHLRKA